MALSLNQRALALAQPLIDDSQALGVAAHTLSNGTRVIDCGIDVPGGLEAGRIFAEVCMGGLGHVSYTSVTYGDWSLPAIAVRSDQPALACMGSQYAGWAVSHGDYFAMGSGPARLLIRAEDLFDHLGFAESDESSAAVLCMESRTMPTAEIAGYIAERARIASDRLTLLIAPTASIVGSVQVAARVLETGLHKLHELDWDIRQTLHGIATCPLPPIARNDGRALGRTNDAILYGGQVFLTVRSEDDLDAVIARVPSSTSRDYGRPFYDVFKEYNFDFYQVDPLLFSPAEIAITNIVTGHTHRAGKVNAEVLRRSYLE
jgi:methenyltetrahydromethanopterin cyclohydrolase